MHTKKQLMVKKYELYFLHARVHLYASYNILYTELLQLSYIISYESTAEI